MDKNTLIFNSALEAFRRCGDLRRKRKRLKDFTYGRQWDDLVVDQRTGERMTEGELSVLATGREPLTNNLIRQMVKTVLGRFRAMRSEEKPGSGNLGEVYRFNRLDELDIRMLEEFLISGCAVQRVVAECRATGSIRTYVDNVSPDDFFISNTYDPRGWDVELIGMLHDYSPAELINRFGRNVSSAELRRMYGNGLIQKHFGSIFGDDDGGDDRFRTSPAGRCRVIEVWTLESHSVTRIHDRRTGSYSEIEGEAPTPDENISLRRDRVNRWHCRCFAPDGSLLHHQLSNLASGDHPFVFKLYPLIDGEIHSFVEDIVDQQRQINRLVNLADHIMATSAKGVLMFPTRCKPDSISWDEIARRWSLCGGMIPYKSTPTNEVPKQVTSSGLDAGVSGLLQSQLKMIRDISGVGDILSGGNSASVAGVDSYREQVRNASVALNDIFASFDDFIARRDEKILEI